MELWNCLLILNKRDGPDQPDGGATVQCIIFCLISRWFIEVLFFPSGQTKKASRTIKLHPLIFWANLNNMWNQLSMDSCHIYSQNWWKTHHSETLQIHGYIFHHMQISPFRAELNLFKHLFDCMDLDKMLKDIFKVKIMKTCAKVVVWSFIGGGVMFKHSHQPISFQQPFGKVCTEWTVC